MKRIFLATMVAATLSGCAGGSIIKQVASSVASTAARKAVEHGIEARRIADEQKRVAEVERVRALENRLKYDHANMVGDVSIWNFIHGKEYADLTADMGDRYVGWRTANGYSSGKNVIVMIPPSESWVRSQSVVKAVQVSEAQGFPLLEMVVEQRDGKVVLR